MVSNLKHVQKKPKLSVVVIAFNNELYIEEALDSLYDQTFKDLEVIVVNDFSSDRTGILIDRYVEGKPNFKAVHLEQNSGGCSTPRNTGIAHAQGEYIMFLDGDDWYTIDACEKLVAAIERTNSDFVAGQAIRTNTYDIWYEKQIYSIERVNINIREFNFLLFDSLSVNKIYKRSFLDKHNLRFPEGIHYEDVVFTGKAYFLAESVSIIPEPVYYWRVVENADVKSISNRRFEFDNFRNRIVAHRQYDKFLKESGFILYQGHKNNRFLRHDLKLYTNDYLEFDEDYKVKFHALIQEYMHEVMDEYAFIRLPERDRIMYYLLYIGDKAAFQDYLSYLNGLPGSMNRIYAEGESYYFRATKPGLNDKKFLGINEIEINYRISDIALDRDQFSFNVDAHAESVDPSEVSFSWVLKNRQTGDTIQRPAVGTRVVFPLNNMAPGNYYLFLYVSHQGNLHKRLIKKSVIEELPNLKAKNESLSKEIFINHKNSFAIKVLPLRKVDQLKFAIQRRRKKYKSNEKLTGLKEVLSNYAKGLFGKLPLQSNWVLFESHMGKQYSDSPKYIYEELYKNRSKFKYIWVFENPDAVQFPGPAIKVKRKTLRHYYYLVRSKFWVDNQGMARLAPKKKQQVYVQTWHGTPLKRMGYDQKKTPSEAALEHLKTHTSAWDYFISPNPYSTAIFRRAFRYGGEILETGYPRNDVLIKKPEIISQKVKEYYRISPEKKVILFAPTFRDWDPNSFQKTLADIKTLSKSINQDSVVLLRLHYLLSDKIHDRDLPANIKNASTYQDIQELYLASDVLVTDYSSVMFDYALLERPIILYCYDLEEYLSRRGTYFDFIEKSPGPVCETIDEVISYLGNPESLTSYNQALKQFAQEFGKLEDGQAARKVIERVFD
ncbi:CDP-glycerol glycerophosphotransferase (TagB/SpsB family)/GT2 family glycosyltransferase [Peribacillus deserti]|uniref:CDP-glycerol glycerophosphotransferase (TagB/SpsB family)/GT2 family glycosyltransferase n=1 Tax=Peribacillus deserti TaxID=673318 RepID=A0ABS2QC46_9BACI|nr:bifunctional glycosyltransferase family 2 protein/CDP-glycerol:glycerophosphate glycerophosphotransferase [Peribacillus deserti]MBM7690737.1 CDP-glycerol glycerophosphotransferase (TagB/SpsB family)/GT2 family glycosyltransferase [Peribacillus deserti]